jgi:hypothetical protein
VNKSGSSGCSVRTTGSVWVRVGKKNSGMASSGVQWYRRCILSICKCICNIHMYVSIYIAPHLGLCRTPGWPHLGSNGITLPGIAGTPWVATVHELIVIVSVSAAAYRDMLYLSIYLSIYLSVYLSFYTCHWYYIHVYVRCNVHVGCIDIHVPWVIYMHM